jgi:hypothetical protein
MYRTGRFGLIICFLSGNSVLPLLVGFKVAFVAIEMGVLLSGKVSLLAVSTASL